MKYELYIIIVTIISAIISYLIGSISSAVIFTRLIAKTDVRDHGSGNAGLTNVLRTAGKKAGIFTLICDLAKGLLSVAVGKYAAYAVLGYLTNGQIKNYLDPLYLAYICGFFCILGHIYPIYFNFRGGKGALSGLGTVILIDWRIFLILLVIFLLSVIITKYISVGSILGAISLPISTIFIQNVKETGTTFSLFGMPQKVVMTIFAALFACLVIIKHKDNIKRLFKGQESKFSIKK
ncbi:MAG: acyl-phosphate glycerol 3-phosphate acyltransferase [Clostridiales bacterium 43-6]|nr:MAG: acyl-phosphate glycerol 3-phosphate acyltransferase [Clostridiales bacterium 43-6]